MVRIRLRRVGLRNQPSYRVIAANSESPRDGKFLEILGNYNPRTEPFSLDIKEDRIYHWMANGAQLSEPVEKLFKSTGIVDRFQRFKSGESVEALLAESTAYFTKRSAEIKNK